MTASLPLREPFFLRGRKSILQRAVIMSLVLGGLTAIVGWIVAAAVVAMGPGESPFLPSLIWGITAALLLYGPLHFWNGRSWRFTLLAIPVSTASLNGFIMFVDHYAQRHVDRTTAMIIGLTGFLLVNGILLIRLSRWHIIAYVASLAGGAVPAAIVFSISDVGQLAIPGVPEEFIVAIVLAAFLGSLFGALAIPWGLPFWWPPAEASTAEPTP
ncbi:hypothetical protein [Planctellipticum variicoloris]|uniref:hypothetical protein n=1 Tax=Planctellipticum variicoloris TaxID=3064265 RepID=UPI00301408CF|nr:hypothetical protein SH412_003475 [Planctomycetaceae bacterium SH412]